MLSLTHRHETHLLAHAELGDHETRHLRSLLNVLGRTRSDLCMPEDEFLCHATAERHGELAEHVLAGVVVAVLLGQRKCQTQRTTARNNRHLVDGVLAGHRAVDDGMAGLMIRRELPLLV